MTSGMHLLRWSLASLASYSLDRHYRYSWNVSVLDDEKRASDGLSRGEEPGHRS